MLLDDGIALNVKDAAQFDASIALTGCSQRGDRVVHCHSGDGNTRATIKALRDDPNIFNLSVLRRRLNIGADRAGAADRAGHRDPAAGIPRAHRRDPTTSAACAAKFSLSCRMP